LFPGNYKQKKKTIIVSRKLHDRRMGGRESQTDSSQLGVHERLHPHHRPGRHEASRRLAHLVRRKRQSDNVVRRHVLGDVCRRLSKNLNDLLSFKTRNTSCM
jgi:hypothetical protein